MNSLWHLNTILLLFFFGWHNRRQPQNVIALWWCGVLSITVSRSEIVHVAVLVLEGVQGVHAPTDFWDSNKLHPQNFGWNFFNFTYFLSFDQTKFTWRYWDHEKRLILLVFIWSCYSLIKLILQPMLKVTNVSAIFEDQKLTWEICPKRDLVTWGSWTSIKKKQKIWTF